MHELSVGKRHPRHRPAVRPGRARAACAHDPGPRGRSRRRVPESLAWCFSAIVCDTPVPEGSLAINPTIGQELQVADIELEEETP